MDVQSIDSIRQQIVVELKKNIPAYEYIDSSLGAEVEPFWIGEVANAIATLYVGYKLGNQIEDIGQALARTIDAVGDIARSVASLIDRIGDIIDEIRKALEAINRKIDSAFMQSHMSDMKASSLLIQDVVKRLQRLPNDASDPRVASYLLRLQNQSDELFSAIIRYTNQEQGRPSPAALIGCCPAVAMWSQSYTILERYKPIAERLPPWQTASQREITAFITSFFDDYIQENGRVRRELETKYLQPTIGSVVEFNGKTFVPSSTKYAIAYPDEPKYHSLFSRDSFNPFNIYSTKQRLSQSPVPTPFPRLTWQAVAESNYTTFPAPTHVLAALKWREQAMPEISVRQRFLAETDRFTEQKPKALDALKIQPDW